ncbi:MAG: hypothetical protein ACYSUQ_14280 [Planctomycetota bacterium]
MIRHAWRPGADGFVLQEATEVGEFENSASTYGTFDQGGNVFEWNGTIIAVQYRGVRGGSAWGWATNMTTEYRAFSTPDGTNEHHGFRLAGTVAALDCNDNGILDTCDVDCGPPAGPCDVAGCGQSGDCNSNGTPDQCETDCNSNGMPDDCEVIMQGDFDADGDVDLDDHTACSDCLGAPSVPPDPTSFDCRSLCLQAFDGNSDGSIDLQDFRAFQESLTGSSS